ncbi:hypothetical protein EVAR_48385_1 [Eumeta japonica]|uniref:Uncharacterized protein n=1 Tax=Eumeta variegata TaxID=151549 RepID=A0A4C1ZB54_EUMVA|nr:hypothetical protein EVAR_48385_1 [Eumeta japonica]
MLVVREQTSAARAYLRPQVRYLMREKSSDRERSGPPELSLTERKQQRKLLLNVCILRECAISPDVPTHFRAVANLARARTCHIHKNFINCVHDMEKLRYRVKYEYELQRGTNAAETARRNQSRGRPETLVDNEKLKVIVEVDPSQTTSELAAGFGVNLKPDHRFGASEGMGRHQLERCRRIAIGGDGHQPRSFLPSLTRCKFLDATGARGRLTTGTAKPPRWPSLRRVPEPWVRFRALLRPPPPLGSGRDRTLSI